MGLEELVLARSALVITDTTRAPAG